MSGISYKDAGVDIDAGEALVDRIRPLAARTKMPWVRGGVGGFAGLSAIPEGYETPILVSGTDGVGTKLRVAFLADKHDTVGIDLVAMCVNDVLTVGAKPLFFLDYFATGKLNVGSAEAVVAGIARGCELAQCALLGGETAEMPGSYPAGEYDLAGFCVGVVEQSKILDGSAACEGDIVVGLPSSGLHSNGFSLARKVLFEHAGLKVDSHVDALGGTLGDALLTPTRIYTTAVTAALEAAPVHGLCHITGGGLPGNLPRVLPDGLDAQIRPGAAPAHALFELIAREGNVSTTEMRRTFNLGTGMTFILPPESVDAVTKALRALGEKPFELGVLVAGGEAEGEARVRYEA